MHANTKPVSPLAVIKNIPTGPKTIEQLIKSALDGYTAPPLLSLEAFEDRLRDLDPLRNYRKT